jgi:hypothetical protein
VPNIEAIQPCDCTDMASGCIREPSDRENPKVIHLGRPEMKDGHESYPSDNGDLPGCANKTTWITLNLDAAAARVISSHERPSRTFVPIDHNPWNLG